MFLNNRVPEIEFWHIHILLFRKMDEQFLTSENID